MMALLTWRSCVASSLTLLATLLHMSETSAADHGPTALRSCEVVPEVVTAAERKRSKTASDAVRDGQWTLITIDGAYDRGLTAPRVDVAQRFYEHAADDYDFLFVFTTFEFGTGDASAFYNTIRNDVEGIGRPPLDLGAQFGSPRRLQGYIDMAALSRWTLNPRDPAYRNVLTVMAHEVMHRWGVRVRYADASGQMRDDLLGREDTHWNYFADTDASLMYGASWTPTTPGRFRSTEVMQRLSWLDLYLAGLADAAEVPPVRLIRSQSGDRGALPVMGAEADGDVEAITIEQVIAAEGERVPSSADAPRAFRGAMILLTRPGESVDPAVLVQLERLRINFETYFQSVTRGRAVLRLDTEPVGASPGSLAPLAGSPLSRAEDPVEAAAAWLIAAQRSDGRWEDRPHTAVRDTAAATQALAKIVSSHPGLEAAWAWLDAQTPATSDARSWQRIGLGSRPSGTTSAPEAAATGGGVALLPGWQSGLWDTALVAYAERHVGVLSPNEASQHAFLGESQNQDGSLGFVRGGAGQRLGTVLAAVALSMSTAPAHQAAVSRAVDWLRVRGIGVGSEQTILERVETLGHASRLGLSAPERYALVQQLLDGQGSAGDFGGSVYATATAASALFAEQAPNLHAFAAVAAPNDAMDGERIHVQVRVRNDGGQSAPPSQGQWFDGTPASGDAWGETLALPGLLPGQEHVVTASLSTRDRVGSRTLGFRADSAQTVTETSETDNDASAPIVIGAAPAGVELVLDGHDLAIDPPVVSRAPQTFRLTGVAHNIGQTPASSVRVSVEDIAAAPRVLGSVVLDLPARGSAPFALDVVSDDVRGMTLRAKIDADDSVPETDEGNNVAELRVPFDGVIDLLVPAQSISVEPAAPVAGTDVRIWFGIANAGAGDAPTSSTTVSIGDGTQWTDLPSIDTQVPGGQTLRQFVTWRPSVAGEMQIRVVADSASAVAESDESNNAATVAVTVVADTAPNLQVAADGLTTDPEVPRQGRGLEATAVIRNIGGAAVEAHNVALYLGDPRAGGQRLASTRVDQPLPPGGEAAVTLDVADYPARGDGFLYLVVDSEDEIPESNEADNTAQRRVTALGKADIAITLASATLSPSPPVTGQPATLILRVDNIGEQPAEAFEVTLAERAGGSDAPVAPIHLIAALEAGASATVQWTWTVGASGTPEALVIGADTGFAVPEASESNNAIVVPLDVQEGDLFVSTRYFSPNGDGVRDDVTLHLGSGLSDVEDRRVLVRNRVQRVVRDLGDGVDAGGDPIVWNGRDDRGELLADGTFAISVETPAGDTLATAQVVLDTDQEGALDAVGTPRGREYTLPLHTNAWQFPPARTPLRDYAYTVGRSDAVLPALRHGVVRAHTSLDDVRPVLSTGWMTQQATRLGVASLQVGQIAFTPDGQRLVISMIETSGATPRASLWTMPSGATDGAVRLAALDEPNPLPIVAFHSAGRVLIDDSIGAEHRYRVLDIAAGSLTDLRALASSAPLIAAVPDGLLIGSTVHPGDQQSLPPATYVPLDAQAPVVTLPAGSDADTGTRFVLSQDRRRYLLHRATEAGERIELVTIATGETLLLHDTPRVDIGPPDAQSGAAKVTGQRAMPTPLALTPHWPQGQGTIAIHDHAARALLLFDADGRPFEMREFPAIERQGPYRPQGNLIPSRVVQAASTRSAWPCEALARPSWTVAQDSAFGADSALHDAASDRYHLLSGELAIADQTSYNQLTSYVCEGATDLLAAGPNGSSERFGGWSVWDLEQSADQARWPKAPMGNTFPGWPQAWPRVIQANGTMLRHDGRIAAAGAGPSDPWPFAAAVRASHDNGARFVSIMDGQVGPTTVFATLYNQTTFLRATSEGRGIRLWGLATDRNFDHFRIDYATLDAPDQWRALVPPTRDEILFDDFLTWAPPTTGAYLFRLTTVDRAGNSRAAVSSADSQFASPITDMRQPSRWISPNGDGALDEFQLDFVVATETTQQVRVVASDGRVIFHDTLVFGANDIGPSSWTWNGHDDHGARAPEGRYDIVWTAGFRLPVTVDVTTPALELELADMYSVAMNQSSDDPLMGWFDWVEREIGLDTDLASRRDGGPWGLAGCASGPSKKCGQLLSHFLGRELRVVQSDKAGNAITRFSGPPDEIIIQRGVGAATAVGASYQRRPFGDDTDSIPDLLFKPQGGIDASPPLILPDTPLRVHGVVFASNVGELRVEIARGTQPDQWSVVAQSGWEPSNSGLTYEIPVSLLDYVGEQSIFIRTVALRADGSQMRSNAFRLRLDLSAAPKIDSQCSARSVENGWSIDCSVVVSELARLRPLAGETLGVRMTSLEEPPVVVGELTLGASDVTAGASRFEVSRHVPRCPHQSWSFSYRTTDFAGRPLRLESGVDTASLLPETSCGTTPSSVKIWQRAATTCGVPHTEQWFATVTSTLVERAAFWVDVYGEASSPLLSIPLGTIDASATQDVPIDLTALPEGTYSVVPRASSAPEWVGASSRIHVDRVAPQLVMLQPQAGQRYCGNVPVEAAVTDARGAAITPMVRTPMPPHRGLLHGFSVSAVQACRGYNLGAAAPDPFPKCVDLADERRHLGIYDFTLQNAPFSDALDDDSLPREVGNREYNGPAMIEVIATDWSGALVCDSREVIYDSRVLLTQNGPLVADGGQRNRLGLPLLSPTTTITTHRQVRRRFLAEEAIRGTLTVLSAQLNAEGAPAVVPGVADQVAQEDAFGEFSVVWSGQGSDASPMPDGLYALRYSGIDDCGFERSFDAFAEVDGTAPTITIAAPANGATVDTAMLVVRGAITDPHAPRYEVLVGPSNGAMTNIASNTFAGTGERELARWSAVGREGDFRLRVVATDALGNKAQLERTFTVPARPRVLADPIVAPALISPNNDGVLDATQVQFSLLASATVTVDVRNRAGDIVHVLRSQTSLDRGEHGFPWGGQGASGIVTDGSYRVHIHAVSSSDPSVVDTQVLEIDVDTAAPTMEPLGVVEGFAACSAGVGLQLDDAHLLDATMRVSSGANAVEAMTVTDTGEHRFSPFEVDDEGPMTLVSQARDAAGNRAEMTLPFVVDCLSPTVALDMLAAQAIVARAPQRPQPLRGTASDANLASWRITLHDLAGTPLEVAAEGTASITDGPLADWVPQAEDGDYVLRLAAEDAAGNRSVVEHAIRIDGTPPVATIASPVNGDTISPQLLLSGSADDTNFDVYHIELATASMAQAGQWVGVFTGQAPVQDDVLASIPIAQSGRVHVRLRVTDKAGFETSDEVWVVLDRQPPPPPTLLGAHVEDSRDVRLSWAGSDVPDLAGFHVYRDGVQITATLVQARQWRDVGTPEGRLRYTVTAVDHAGNESEPSNMLDAVVDRTAPDVELHAPGSGERVRGSVRIVGTAWSATDFDRWELQLLDAASGQEQTVLARGSAPPRAQTLVDWNTTTVADERAMRLRLVGHDRSGNAATADVTVVVDNLAPAAPVNVSAVVGTEVVALQWDANTEPDLLGYLVYRGGELIGGGDGADLRPFAIRENALNDDDAPDGQYGYRIYAIDLAGNVSPPSIPAAVDTQFGPPHLTLVRPQEGEQFDRPLRVEGVTSDRDIAEVAFFYRAVGTAPWTAIASPVQEAPWRVSFDPSGLPHGDYEITAMTTDTVGLLDPEPPLVRVVHVDLTPPAAPTGVDARGDGDSVRVTWTASIDADVASYSVEVFSFYDGDWIQVGDVAATELVDSMGWPDGELVYRVVAVDHAGNRSQPSSVDAAHLFSIAFEPLASPVVETLLDAQVVSGRACNLEAVVTSDTGTLPLAPVPVPPDYIPQVVQVPLEIGPNSLTATCLDGEGNRSRLAEGWVLRGAIPEPPTNVRGSIDQPVPGALQVQWDASPSTDVVGYRVWRNGVAVHADGPVAQPLTVMATADGPEAAVDSDITTAWEVASGTSTNLDAILLVQWNDPAMISGLRLRFADATTRATSFRVMGLTPAGYEVIAEREGNELADVTVLFARPNALTGIYIAFDRVSAQGALLRLAEVDVLERDLVEDLETTLDLSEGRYVYAVSAVSALGFESVRSDPWLLSHGDDEAPAPVELSGTVLGSDAQLQWTASSSTDAAAYVVERDGVEIAQTSATILTHVDAALANGAYTYTVRVRDAVGNTSERSNALLLQIAQAGPGMPAFTAAAAAADGSSADLAWEAGVGASTVRFILRRSDDDPSTFAEIARPTTLSYRDFDVMEGATYRYTLEAVDGSGNLSGQTAPATVTMEAAPGVLHAPVLMHPTVSGRPIAWTQPRAQVCGVAPAGTTVTLHRNGLTTGLVETASPTFRRRDVPRRELYGSRSVVAVHPNGDVLYVDDGAPHYFSIRTGTYTPAPFLYEPSFSGDGAAIFSRSSPYLLPYVFHRDTLATGERATFDFNFSYVSTFRFAPDGSRIAVVGRHTSAPAEAMYVADTASGSVQRIDTEEDGVRWMRWSGDGQTLLLLRDNGTMVSWTDEDGVAPLAMTDVSTDIPPAVSADASMVAYLEQRPWPENARLRLRQLSSGDDRVLLELSDPSGAIAFSSDGRQLAVDSGYQLRLFDTQSAMQVASTDVSYASPNELIWTRSGRLVKLGSNAFYADPPGHVCFDHVSVPLGDNAFTAVAVSEDGVSSPVSDAIVLQVERGTAAAADFEVTAADIVFVPARARPEDAVGAYVTVRNRGAHAGILELGLSRRAPGGTVSALPMPTSVSLAAGQAKTFPVELGALPLGDHLLLVHADPNHRIDELDEANNQAFAQLSVSQSTGPQLTLTAVSAIVAPGEQAIGDVALVHYGAPLSGTVKVRVLDHESNLVADLSQERVVALPYASPWVRPWSWRPDGVTAGTYIVDARLVGDDGVERASAAQAIVVGADRHIDLSLTAAQPNATVGDDVALQADVAFRRGNAALVDATVRIDIAAAEQPATLLHQQVVGRLAPGQSLRIRKTWQTLGLAPGRYLARVALDAADHASSRSIELHLSERLPSVALRGSIALNPGTLALGSEATVTYRIDSIGTAPPGEVLARLQLIAGVSGDVIHGVDNTHVLGLAGHGEGALTATSQSLTLGSYALRLEAQRPGGAWQLLAQQTLPVIDAVAPEASWVTPEGTVATRSPVSLQVRARDAHSRVAAVEYTVDGSAWRPIGAGADGLYQGSLLGLSDGEHRVRARATDAWGNVTLLDERAFVVDNTAPAIVIASPQPASLHTQAVLPDIVVTDADTVTWEQWVDDVLVAPLSPIVADGAHRLVVRASDAAGNRAEAAVAFVIDTQAPSLAFLAPTDGLRTPAATVDATLATEPAARVEVRTGSFVAEATADNAGRVDFIGIPLQIGAQVLTAVAQDAAGNTGAPASVTIERVVGGVGLGGSVTLQPALVEPGDALTVRLQLFHGGLAALVDEPIRLDVVHSDGTLLHTESLLTTVPAGAPVVIDRAPASGAWGLGAASVQLWALDGGGDLLLDSATLTLADQSAPNVEWLQPAHGAVLRTPLLTEVAVIDALSAVGTVEWSADGGPWAAFAPFGGGRYGATLPTLADGAHTLAARASDAAGNLSGAVVRTMVVDNTPPQIVVHGLIDNGLYASAVTPVVTVLDAHPDTLALELGGAPFTSGTVVSDEGTHALVAIATDAAGNTSERRTTFSIDLTPPEVLVLSPADGATVTTSPVVVVVRTEAHATVTLLGPTGQQLTANADATGAAAFATVQLLEGENDLALSARDPAGNQGPTVAHRLVLAPAPADLVGTLEIDDPVPGGAAMRVGYTVTNRSNVALNPLALRLRIARAGDVSLLLDDAFETTLAGGATVEGERSAQTTTWAVGQHVATLEAQHQGAWVALASGVFDVVDREGPQLAPTAPSAGSVRRQDVQVAAVAVDRLGSVARVEARLGASFWTELASNGGDGFAGTLPFPADGAHTLVFRAFDDVGNVTVSELIPIVSDTAPPVVRIDGATEGEIRNLPFTLTAHVDDATPTTQTFTVDGAAYDGSAVAAEGAHIARLSAVDAAGNTAVVERHFSIDTTPPALQVVSPIDGTRTAQGAITIIVASEPGATVDLEGVDATRSIVADQHGVALFGGVTLRNGENTFTFRATDAAGNRSEQVSLRVLRTAEGLAAVRGALQSPARVIAGPTLTVQWDVVNEGAVGLAGADIRLDATMASGVEVTQRDVTTADLAVGVPQSKIVGIDTAAWALGVARLELSAGHAGARVVLARADVDLVSEILPLTLSSPQDGARVDAGTIDFVGTTEAGAQIEIRGSHGVSTTVAGADGSFMVSAVPLLAGANRFTIEAAADDGRRSAGLRLMVMQGADTPAVPAVPVIIDVLGREGIWLLVLLLAAGALWRLRLNRAAVRA